MKIQELFDNKSKWTKGYLASNSNGDLCNVYDRDAQCFCLIGAIYHCYRGEQTSEVLNKVRKEISNQLKINDSDNVSIAEFNDSDLTSFEDIKKMVTKLDI